MTAQAPGFRFHMGFTLRCAMVLLVAGILCSAPTALAKHRPAEAPRPFTFSQPAAIAPGVATEVAFFGDDLGEPLGLWTSFPATITPLSIKGGPIRYRILTPADMQVGIGAVRLLTTTGTSSLQLFMVDDLPSVVCQDKNLTLREALALLGSIAVDGTSTPLASQFFKFTAKAGQRVSIEVVAAQLGSRMDPVLRLSDSAGQELVYCDDTPGLGSDMRLAHTFANEGEYFIELRDSNFEGGNDHRYRLRLGDFPLATVPFPAGGRKGTEANVTFADASPMSIKFPTDCVRIAVGFKLPGSVSSSFANLVCSDIDEFIATAANHSSADAAAIKLPLTINGRFLSPAQRDYYKFQAKKGERLSFQCRGRSLGSPCDLVLHVTKANGTALAEIGAGEAKIPKAKSPEPELGADEYRLDVLIPETGAYQLIAEELSHAAGPGIVYRIEASRPRAGFSLTVDTEKVDAVAGKSFTIKVKCVRNKYDGPITLAVKGLEGCELKNDTIGAGKTEADLEVKVPVGLQAGLVAMSIVGTAHIGNDDVTQIASTMPALRKLFPQMRYPMLEFENQIGLGVRKAE